MEDKYLQSKFKPLSNQVSAPHPKVWNRLESRLKQERKQRFQNTFNISVAAALIILFGVVFTQMIYTSKPTAETANQIQKLKLDSTQTQDTLQLKE